MDIVIELKTLMNMKVKVIVLVDGILGKRQGKLEIRRRFERFQTKALLRSARIQGKVQEIRRDERLVSFQ